MTSTIALTKALPAYEQAAESFYDLDWAGLVTLDLSKFDQPDGRTATQGCTD